MRSLRLTRRVVLISAAGIVLVAVAIGVSALRPTGTATAEEAVRAHLRPQAAGGSLDLRYELPWGEGLMVLARFSDGQQRTRLALSFAIDHGRGWRVAASTATSVTPTDVQVGSLVVSTGPLGKGQPPWSAAYGEVSREGITDVEVVWTADPPTKVNVKDGAYLVLRRGLHQVKSVRFLGEGGAEIALVPVS